MQTFNIWNFVINTQKNGSISCVQVCEHSSQNNNNYTNQEKCRVKSKSTLEVYKSGEKARCDLNSDADNTAINTGYVFIFVGSKFYYENVSCPAVNNHNGINSVIGLEYRL